jgi:uncharacterized phage protein (TIGR01671 family)
MKNRYFFRAVGIGSGTWEQGAIAHDCTGYYVIRTTNGETVKTQVNEHTISQCTGLKDMAGTLIYEGDIIREVYNTPNGNTIVYTERVSWSKDGSGWTLADDNSGNTVALTPSLAGEISVVGNIHDHPESQCGRR